MHYHITIKTMCDLVVQFSTLLSMLLTTFHNLASISILCHLVFIYTLSVKKVMAVRPSLTFFNGKV